MEETLKRIPYQTKTADVDEKGVVTVAVNGIGIEDSQKDISMPGSFVETVANDIQRMRWFLNHDTTQLLGVPLYGEEKSDNLIMTGQLNLAKQIGRDILADYRLYAEAGRTLEHSIGVKALVRDKDDKRKVRKWKMYEYSTLTSWGANPNTYLVGIKSATPTQVRDAIDFLKMAVKQKGYSDERLMNIEKELDACFKALEGGHIVVCPHCGHQFDYDEAEQHTFNQQVLEYANMYTRWIADDVVYEQIQALEPAIRAEVIAVLDACKGAKMELNEKSVTDFMSYARCPHCWGKVYAANDLLIKPETETKEVETPIVDAPAPEVKEAVAEKKEDDFFETLNKCIFPKPGK